MAEKPSKADKILEVMDDLSEAIDGFAARFQTFQMLLENLHDDLVGVRNTLDTMDERTDQMHGRLNDTQTTVDTMQDRVEDIGKIAENLEKNFPDFQEVADEMRSRQRQEQLFEARAAMGKVKFISMRG